MASRSYRADIDGLRALAVLTVLLFHLDIGLFSGGYIGVDVFFVISGYLITGIIRDELASGRFCLWQFYERRIRRIFPALFAMLALVTVAAWILMLPMDLKNYGQSTAAATLFASNILFIFEAGYFDAPAELKPLLHTWSLAVEEQYYLVFPLLMIAIWFGAKRRLLVVLVAFLMLSFILALVGTDRFPIIAFFLSPTRFWELLAGALLALHILPPWRRTAAIAASWIGLILILAASVLFNRETPFPGIAALLPVAGAVLLIHSGAATSHYLSANTLLALRPAVYIGLISYSLYLWHWPIIVFTKYTLIHDLNPLQQSLIAIASFAAAYLSWRFVEQPYRHRQLAVTRSRLFTQAAFAMAGATAIGVILSEREGFPGRYPADIIALDQDQRYVSFRNDCRERALDEEMVCIRGDVSMQPDFMLLGDSHAISISPAVFAAAGEVGRAGVQITEPGYRPFLDYARRGFEAVDKQIDAEFRRTLRDYPSIRTVFIIAHWKLATELGHIDPATGKTVNLEIIDLGLLPLVERYPEHHFVIIRDFPISERFGANRLAREITFGHPPTMGIARDLHERINAPYVARLAELADRANTTVTNLDDVYCDATTCHAAENGRSLYRDADHVSLIGALKAKGFFVDLLMQTNQARQHRRRLPGRCGVRAD